MATQLYRQGLLKPQCQTQKPATSIVLTKLQCSSYVIATYLSNIKWRKCITTLHSKVVTLNNYVTISYLPQALNPSTRCLYRRVLLSGLPWELSHGNGAMLSPCSGNLPGQWNRGEVLSGYLVLSRSAVHTTLNQPEIYRVLSRGVITLSRGTITWCDNVMLSCGVITWCNHIIT